jgi:RHS repeat-associated protein
LNLTYARDAAGQLQGDGTSTWSYDTVNRLTNANGSPAWTYDSADNLTGAPKMSGTTYDVANELTAATISGSATQFSYDARGNRTQSTAGATTTSLGYDQANRLTSYGATATYGYNGDGLRMSKTFSGATTQQTWDLSGSLGLLIQDGTTSYVTGPGGLPFEQITGGGVVTYYHHDQLGSVRALSNSSGVVIGTATYDAYGSTTATTGTTTPFGYAGQYTDNESSLVYLRARYDDPSTGQFTSRDPAVALTREPYSYSTDNPLNFTDPSGLAASGYGMGVLINHREHRPDPVMPTWMQYTLLGIGGAGAFALGCAVVCPAAGLLTAGGGAALPTVIIDSEQMPNISAGIQEAQSAGAPSVLTRITDAAQIAANRAAACRGFAGEGSPDEYPFASTAQGGAGAFVRGVPLVEQKIQGGVLSRFYQDEGIQAGDRFAVRAQ